MEIVSNKVDWCLNHVYLVLRGLKLDKKIAPIPFHHQQQPELLIQFMHASLYQILTLPPEQEQRLISVLFFAERSGTQCGVLLL